LQRQPEEKLDNYNLPK